MKSIQQVYESMLVQEGFKDFGKAMQLVTNYLLKHDVYVFPLMNNFQVNGNTYTGTMCWTKNSSIGALIMWEKVGTAATELDYIAFTDDVDREILAYQNGGSYNFKVTVESYEVGISKALQLVASVLNGETKMDKASIGKYIGNELFTEGLVNEDELSDLNKKIGFLYRQIGKAEKEHGKGSKEVENLVKQRADLIAKRKLARVKVDTNKTIKIGELKAEPSVEDEFEERVDPELRFQDMEGYVQMVINGLKPLAILCGAPGVGKTYRVKKLIRGLGKHISTSGYKDIGTDAIILKGSETAVSLFIKMFQFKEKGDLIVLDDCDKVLKDETAINLIKAATDSDDVRVVSYGTSRPPECPASLAEIHPEWNLEMDSKGRYYFPQSFVFNGSIVIITNMRAGMIDTAIRNRGLICDLDFTTEEILGIVESLAPKIDPEHIGMPAKIKAIEYLKNLAAKGTDMEISIRSFMTCACLYESCPDETACERRIKEQMKLQFASGGKRY